MSKLIQDANSIASMVLYHRKRAGLSRKALAEYAGVGKTIIYDLEHGRSSIRLDLLLKILTVLNLKLYINGPLEDGVEDDS